MKRSFATVLIFLGVGLLSHKAQSHGFNKEEIKALQKINKNTTKNLNDYLDTQIDYLNTKLEEITQLILKQSVSATFVSTSGLSVVPITSVPTSIPSVVPIASVPTVLQRDVLLEFYDATNGPR